MSHEKATGGQASGSEMSVGELARRTGVSTATINFYVKEGVLPAPRRINRTRAAYDARHERLILLVRRCQNNGLSLAFIKRFMLARAKSDEDLASLEQIGFLQPLPAPRGSADPTPIEFFDPVDRATFLAMAGVEPELLDRFESFGLVRPSAPDRYGAGELWAVRNLLTLLDDGIAIDDLKALSSMVLALKAGLPLVRTSARHHREALRRRSLRFRDVLTVYANLEHYLFERISEEDDPGWRERFFEGFDPSE